MQALDIPLVMTAAINPKGMSGLSVNDVTERQGQYLGVLEFYLSRGWAQRIVFAENSGSGLEVFRELAGRYPEVEVEFLSCDLNDYPRQLGKSYGELQVLDYVVDHSRLVAEAGRFAKVTGRFPILNYAKLISEAEKRKPWELFCDNKDHNIYDWLHLGWTGHACDTRFFAVETQFYREHFYGRESELDDSQGRLIEFLFFETARQAKTNGIQVIRRFMTEPEYAGKAGHVQISIIGVNNYSSWIAITKRRLRQAGRWVLPWFWF